MTTSAQVLIGKFRPKMVRQLAQADAIMGREETVMFHRQQLQNGFEPAVLDCRYQNWLTNAKLEVLQSCRNLP